MRTGFSLVELSIVLVILGLLTGGILAGQSLIRASELRSVTADVQRFSSVVYTFRDKYFAMPGDMSNATKFWQAAGTCPGTNATPQTTTATCDGNGDGEIGRGSGAVNSEDAEILLAWKHLANAGLIEGSYSGVTDHTDIAASLPQYNTGWNVPKSKLGNGGYVLWYRYNPTGASSQFPHIATKISFGTYPSGSTEAGAIIKPEEAWNIDTKMDDGRPALGQIHSGTFLACVTTNVPSTAEYFLTNTGQNCILHFFLK